MPFNRYSQSFLILAVSLSLAACGKSTTSPHGSAPGPKPPPHNALGFVHELGPMAAAEWNAELAAEFWNKQIAQDSRIPEIRGWLVKLQSADPIIISEQTTLREFRTIGDTLVQAISTTTPTTTVTDFYLVEGPETITRRAQASMSHATHGSGQSWIFSGRENMPTLWLMHVPESGGSITWAFTQGQDSHPSLRQGVILNYHANGLMAGSSYLSGDPIGWSCWDIHLRNTTCY